MRNHPATPAVLVSMPWASIRRPHLGLATLSGQLNAQGFDCEVLYLSIAFATAIGQEAYETLADAPGLSAACEHVFALGLFDAQSLDFESFLNLYTTSSGDNPFRHIREHHAAPFVEQARNLLLVFSIRNTACLR